MKFASIGEQDSSIDAGDQDWLAFLDKHFIPFFSRSLCQTLQWYSSVSLTRRGKRRGRAQTGEREMEKCRIPIENSPCFHL